MYPSDFIHAAPAPTVAPTLLAALLALAAALTVAAFFAGRAVQRRAEADVRTAAAARIYGRIVRAASRAARASRDEVEPAARRLSDTLADSLGSVLILARGAQGPVRALNRALAGEAAARNAAKEWDGPEVNSPGALQVAVYRPETVIVGEGGALSPQKPAEPASGSAVRSLTRVEQIAAIRAAVDAIADHWADRPARIAEIRAAQSQLTAGAVVGSSSRHSEA